MFSKKYKNEAFAVITKKIMRLIEFIIEYDLLVIIK